MWNLKSTVVFTLQFIFCRSHMRLSWNFNFGLCNLIDFHACFLLYFGEFHDKCFEGFSHHIE